MIPIHPSAFNAGGWQQFHHYCTGGQGWSLPPADDLTRLRMVDDLATRGLRIGMPYSEARELLGAPESSCDEGDSYNLTARTSPLIDLLIVRRWGTRNPGLTLSFEHDKLTDFSIH